MGRKTVDVETVKNQVNTMLRTVDSSLRLENLFTSEPMTAEQAFRLGAASVLEQILHMTGNYHGYYYLADEYKPADEQTDRDVLRDEYDETRRNYF